MKQILKKLATIILFLSLIIVYITFRSGYFGGEKSTVSVSPNGSALNNLTKSEENDSNYVETRKDEIDAALTSSKSSILESHVRKALKTDEKIIYPSDTTKKYSIIQINGAEMFKDVPEFIKRRKKDSIKWDSINKVIITRKRTNISKLSSSKSMILAPEIIEVLKKDTTDKDSLIKK